MNTSDVKGADRFTAAMAVSPPPGHKHAVHHGVQGKGPQWTRWTQEQISKTSLAAQQTTSSFSVSSINPRISESQPRGKNEGPLQNPRESPGCSVSTRTPCATMRKRPAPPGRGRAATGCTPSRTLHPERHPRPAGAGPVHGGYRAFWSGAAWRRRCPFWTGRRLCCEEKLAALRAAQLEAAQRRNGWSVPRRGRRGRYA